MMNLDHSNYTETRIRKIGYVVICSLLKEIIISGKRIAFFSELKSLKKLVDPLNVELDDDTDLLRILDEPHVRLASALADHIWLNVLDLYALVNLLDDAEVLSDEWASETGFCLSYKFIFYRKHPRQKDRYVNFTRMLRSGQRLIYELLKLIVTGETSAFDHNYRSNYSAGRLKALLVGSDDRNVPMLAALIDCLAAYELESRDLILKSNSI